MSLKTNLEFSKLNQIHQLCPNYIELCAGDSCFHLRKYSFEIWERFVKLPFPQSALPLNQL